MTSELKELLKEKTNKSRLFKIVFAGTFVLLSMFTALAVNAQKYQGKFYNNVDARGVILNGYDPVAFFTENKPVKGNAAFAFNYEDATYYFASQYHLDLFKSNPEKYKPQFGAWCAYAVSLGRVAPIDVTTFSIVNSRLVIQHNQKAVKGWNEDIEGNLKLADKYWPKVTANGGRQIQTTAEIQMIIWISTALVIVALLTYLAVRKFRKPKLSDYLKRQRSVTIQRNFQNTALHNKI